METKAEWDYTAQKERCYNIANATGSECALCLNPIHKNKRYKANSRKRVWISKDTKYSLYLNHNLILGPNHYMCSKCSKIPDSEKKVIDQAYDLVVISTHSFVNDLLDSHNIYHRKLRNKNNTLNEKCLLALDKLDNKQTKQTCGITKENIDCIVKRLKDDNDVVINVLHLFIALTVWFNNIGCRFAAILFGYEDKSSICYAIDNVINTLTFYWVPKYIGYHCWTATKILSTVPQFVEDLYPNKKILGCIDATYLYKQHSNTNFQYQKLTYSVHKHKNLQKEHVWCTSEGKVVLVDGPYSADKGDWVIWDSIINDPNHELYDIINLRDDSKCPYSIIADRGYTQVETLSRAPELVTTQGVKTKPNVKKGDPKQLTTEQADSSRFVLLTLSHCVTLSPAACLNT